jgi:acetyl-CoA carboxylase biotin carboxylase subunit
MKIVHNESELEIAVSSAKKEAAAAFGDGTVYLEKFLTTPRHIEIQVLADTHGNVIHLGERDCSLQRRHQKVLEESPSPALNSKERDAIGEVCRQAVLKLGYRGAGTIEFLYENGEFYFIEMNTRIQVEHPVTEIITGIDLVKEQIRVADGLELKYKQDEVKFSGHSMECRINAEDPFTFMPSPGQVTDYHPPGGLEVRVESAVYARYHIPPHYDSMIAKLVVHGKTRNECLMRLRRSLEEYVIDGIKTTIPLHQKLIREDDFINGDYNIHWLEKYLDNLVVD